MDEMWNTKVFVDKLPKSCNDCVVDHCGEWCCLNGVEIDTWSYNETRPKECPLKSLFDYTEQVRKEVVDDVKNRIINYCRRQDKKPFQKSIEQIKVDLLTSINQIQESSINGQNE